jgi:hypothetical protein
MELLIMLPKQKMAVSTTRLAVTIELINTLPASNYEELLCDDLNDGTETVNLNNYESNIISSNPYILSYYSTVAGENELSANKITNTSQLQIKFRNQHNLCSHQFKYALLCDYHIKTDCRC